MEIFKLIYTSMATCTVDNNVLSSIEAVAGEVNADLHVTGALLYSSKHFVQLLEGDRNDVEDIFEKICRDDRHKNIIVNLRASSDERLFPFWSMAVIDLDATENELEYSDLWNSIDLSKAIREKTAGVFMDLFSRLSIRVGQCVC